MKRLMVLGAVCALAMAKPEQYKEKEDFQFSRSSSDDGNKSGYYGAQRGNMGGNFERAHNMDSLAQHQMGGLVKQVEGELGDGANMRTGSVYSAANSRGTYGSGKLDLSNLGGRNFQEGATYGESQSQSSQSHQAGSAYNAAAYTNSHSQSSRHSGYQATGQSGYQATGQNGYQATGHSGLNHQSDDLQALTDHAQGNGQYDYGRQTSQAAGYNAQSGFQQHSSYDASNSNLQSGGYGSNVHTRLISATPVRVIVTPGGRVAIPIAAQTYDLTRGSALVDQNSLNSDAEVLSNDNQRTVYRVPVGSNAKHYESSYNYRKEWEKHDTIPSTVISPTSTDNPFPKNSELYEDGQALRTGSQQYDTRRVDSQRANSAYGGYNAAVKTTSGQSRFNYDTQRNAASHTNENAYSGAGYGTSHGTSSDASLNGYNVQSQYNTGRYHEASADALAQAAVHNTGYNAAADLNSQVENLNSKPKSYQSAYSYHKSWERQGDPYVIKPTAYYDGQSAQRLTTGSTQNLGYSTGSHYQHSHASGADCDENGQARVARSVSSDQLQDMQQQSQNLEDLGQQSQNLEDFGQQQSQNLEYFGQQQQSQNLQDFGQQQQSQNLDDLGQQQQSQNLEDFGQQQQSQNLEDFGQQQQSQNLEDLGQQQQSQNLEDFGQQQQQNLGQQTEFQRDAQQEGGQLIQNTWDYIDTLNLPTNNKRDGTWDKFQDLGQKPQDNQNELGQRPQASETELNNNTQDQQAQDKWSFNFNSQDQQQNAGTHNQEQEQSNQFNQQETQPQLSVDDIYNYLQQSQRHNNDQISVWDKFDFGSHQNTQQHKYNNEQTNSNGNQVNWSSVSQQVGRDQPLNSGLKPESQSVYHNVNNDSTAEQVTSTTQSYKTPGAYEQSNTGSDINNGHFNIHTNQNQFWNNENSFQESHNYHQSSSSYYSSSHRHEQTTNTDSDPHVNAFETFSPNTAPLASLWDKFDNFESLVMDNVDKSEGNAFSQGHTNTQNSYENSMYASHNIESTSQENLNGQMNPGLIIPINENDESQNKQNDTNTEKESSLDVGRGDISPEDLLVLKPDKYSNIPISTETPQIQGENSVNKNNTHGHHYIQDVQHQEHTHGQNYFHQHHGYQEQNNAEQMEQQNLHVLSPHQTIEPPSQQDSQKQHNLEQHNVQDSKESLGQQNQHDISQQVNKDQILSDFEKQDNLEQQNLQDFGQQANVEQQNLQDFGQQANVEQQNLQDFGQQANLEQQNLQDFEKQDNLGQQNLQDFGQQENVEQQNLQDFGQQANVEQQNLQDFGQQTNLEQQNLQDFGQQANLEQQNLNGFDEQDNLQQQNLQDFGQRENLEQQNLQGFDNQDNLKQHNLQDFGSQDNKQHQNKNHEQLNQDPEQPFKYSKEERTALPKNKVQSQTYLAPPEEIEQPIVKKENHDLQSISAQTPSTEASPIEPVTEKTGFWKSVGNKLSSAKSKIASWFS